MNLTAGKLRFARTLSFSVAAAFVPVAGMAALPNFPFNQGVLPEANKFIESMCDVDVNAKELLIQSEGWRHRVVVFVYPRNSTHLWVWDPDSKSHEFKTNANDALAIAKAWGSLMVPGQRILDASFSLPANSKCKPPAATEAAP